MFKVQDATADVLIARTKKKGFAPVQYTEHDLFNWLWAQPNAQNLYDAWVASDYATAKRPSVDRIDDYKPYSLDNIQLKSWEVHSGRYYKDAIEGVNTKSAKAVKQFTLEGVLVQEFHSLSAAARSVNGVPSNINQAINGKFQQAYGYRWTT